MLFEKRNCFEAVARRVDDARFELVFQKVLKSLTGDVMIFNDES